jgi:hypothetical protein
MPDIVKKSGWNRQFKSHDKTQKRSITGAEAAEDDATRREQAMAREARLQGTNSYLLQGPEPIRSFLPPASTEVEMVPDTPPRRAPVAASPSLFPQIRPLPQVAFVPANPILFSQFRTVTPPQEAPAPANLILSSQVQPNIEEEEEEEEEALILPPSTAPAILSRGGRKRALTMKALEAEMAPKRGTGQARAGRGRAEAVEEANRGRGIGTGSRGCRQVLPRQIDVIKCPVQS